MENKETILLEKAQNGDAQAMFELGSYYFLLPRCEFEKAIYWYEKALENGNDEAIYWLARVYEELDIQKASKLNPNSEFITYELSENTKNWYLKALDYFETIYQDNPMYAVTAAELLSDPEDAIMIDYEKAFKYYLAVADMEYDDYIWVNIACARVAKMFELGIGCEIDLEKSKYYKEKSQVDEEYYNNIQFIE